MGSVPLSLELLLDFPALFLLGQPLFLGFPSRFQPLLSGHHIDLVHLSGLEGHGFPGQPRLLRVSPSPFPLPLHRQGFQKGLLTIGGFGNLELVGEGGSVSFPMLVQQIEGHFQAPPQHHRQFPMLHLEGLGHLVTPLQVEQIGGHLSQPDFRPPCPLGVPSEKHPCSFQLQLDLSQAGGVAGLDQIQIHRRNGLSRRDGFRLGQGSGHRFGLLLTGGGNLSLGTSLGLFHLPASRHHQRFGLLSGPTGLFQVAPKGGRFLLHAGPLFFRLLGLLGLLVSPGLDPSGFLLRQFRPLPVDILPVLAAVLLLLQIMDFTTQTLNFVAKGFLAILLLNGPSGRSKGAYGENDGKKCGKHGGFRTSGKERVRETAPEG